MVPHKTQRGQNALANLATYEGDPVPYDRMKRLVVPDALQAIRLQVLTETYYMLSSLSTHILSKARSHLATIPLLTNLLNYFILLHIGRLQQKGRRMCLLGSLAKEVGWGHGELVASLETQRKTKEQSYYTIKTKAVVSANNLAKDAKLATINRTLSSKGF